MKSLIRIALVVAFFAPNLSAADRGHESSNRRQPCHASGRQAPTCDCPRCSAEREPEDCVKKPCDRCVPKQPPTPPDREGPPTQDNPPPMLGPRGSYVAPPRSGVAVGESRALGLNGMAIKFPAIRLEMPSIEFPSVSRMRRSAHMRVDAATAPFVEEAGYAAYDQYAARGYAYDQGGAVQAPRSAPPERDAPPSCSKSRDANSDREAEFEQRLKRLDEAEKCLREQMQRLQDCLEGLDAARGGTAGGALDVGPKPEYQEGRQFTPTRIAPVAEYDVTPVQQSAYVARGTPYRAEAQSIRRLPPAITASPSVEISPRPMPRSATSRVAK